MKQRESIEKEEQKTINIVCKAFQSSLSEVYPFIFRGCPACFLILKGVVISSHETNRFS